MRYIPIFFIIALLALGACNKSISIGTRTGNTGIRVSTGTTGSGVGIYTGSGMAMAVNSHNDFLYSGNSEAYRTNKEGLKALLDKEYEKARSTFEANLKKYPGNPDAMFYLGLTLIYLDDREAGYAQLLNYRDPYKVRISQDVRWWAAYCQKKPELTPDKIHQVMNKARVEGYNRDQEEDRERLGW